MVSIIIPTFNEEGLIAKTLKNVLSQEGPYEVIVIDGGSTDKTLNIVRTFKDVKCAISPKGRALQMNFGAKLAKGNILLFLHADTLLSANAILEIEDTIETDRLSSGSFYLKFDHDNMLLRIYSFLSKINHSSFTYGDQGIFVKRSLFDEINGFANIPIMEDVEIQSRLKQKGKFVKLKLPVYTSARRFIKTGIVKQQVLNLMLVILYKLGVPPERLKNYYR